MLGVGLETIGNEHTLLGVYLLRTGCWRVRLVASSDLGGLSKAPGLPGGPDEAVTR